MPKISITWDQGRRFDGYDSKGMPVDVDGDQRLGVKPSDLLPMALAACSATDLVELIGDRIVDLAVQATYTQKPEPPWGFQRIRLHYTITGRGLTEGDVAEAIRRSEQEMCSVAASISVPVESTFDLSPG